MESLCFREYSFFFKKKENNDNSNSAISFGAATFHGQLTRVLRFPEDLANLDCLFENYQNQYTVRVGIVK